MATYPSSVPLTIFTLTHICFGSCDTASNHDDDVIVLDDDDMRGHKETQRLVELLLVANKYGSITCLKRCECGLTLIAGSFNVTEMVMQLCVITFKLKTDWHRLVCVYVCVCV